MLDNQRRTSKRIVALASVLLLALAGCNDGGDIRPDPDAGGEDARNGDEDFSFEGIERIEPYVVDAADPEEVEIFLETDGEIPDDADVEFLVGGDNGEDVHIVQEKTKLHGTPPSNPGVAGSFDVAVAIDGVEHTLEPGIRYRVGLDELTVDAPEATALPGIERAVEVWNVSEYSPDDELELLVFGGDVDGEGELENCSIVHLSRDGDGLQHENDHDQPCPETPNTDNELRGTFGDRKSASDHGRLGLDSTGEETDEFVLPPRILKGADGDKTIEKTRFVEGELVDPETVDDIEAGVTVVDALATNNPGPVFGGPTGGAKIIGGQVDQGRKSITVKLLDAGGEDNQWEIDSRAIAVDLDDIAEGDVPFRLVQAPGALPYAMWMERDADTGEWYVAYMELRKEVEKKKLEFDDAPAGDDAPSFDVALGDLDGDATVDALVGLSEHTENDRVEHSTRVAMGSESDAGLEFGADGESYTFRDADGDGFDADVAGLRITGEGDEQRVLLSKRSARKGRNPQTGKEIKIPAGGGAPDSGARGTDVLELAPLDNDGDQDGGSGMNKAELIDSIASEASLASTIGGDGDEDVVALEGGYAEFIDFDAPTNVEIDGTPVEAADATYASKALKKGNRVALMAKSEGKVKFFDEGKTYRLTEGSSDVYVGRCSLGDLDDGDTMCRHHPDDPTGQWEWSRLELPGDLVFGGTLHLSARVKPVAGTQNPEVDSKEALDAFIDTTTKALEDDSDSERRLVHVSLPDDGEAEIESTIELHGPGSSGELVFSDDYVVGVDQEGIGAARLVDDEGESDGEVELEATGLMGEFGDDVDPDEIDAFAYGALSDDGDDCEFECTVDPYCFCPERDGIWVLASGIDDVQVAGWAVRFKPGAETSSPVAIESSNDDDDDSPDVGGLVGVAEPTNDGSPGAAYRGSKPGATILSDWTTHLSGGADGDMATESTAIEYVGGGDDDKPCAGTPDVCPPTGYHPADVDGDGWPDLVNPGGYDDGTLQPVRVFRNTGDDASFEAPGVEIVSERLLRGPRQPLLHDPGAPGLAPAAVQIRGRLYTPGVE